MNPSCIFCRIAAGEIPATIIYEDDECLAFRDINPQAPVHALVIPRKHIASLAEAGDADAALLGRLLLAGARVAKQEGLGDDLDARGFRTVVNTGAGAGQSVFHIHVHILGGRSFGWGPG